MKMKKIIIGALCSLFMLCGCEGKNRVLYEGNFKSYFSEIFDVNRVNKVTDKYTGCYYAEMEVDGIPFYVFSQTQSHPVVTDDPEICGEFEECYEYREGFTFCTSIVVSMYDKNKKEIENLANKYHLNLNYEEFNFLPYSNIWNEILMDKIVINVDISELENIHKFSCEVIKIDDIQKLYDLAYDKEDMELYDKLMVYDFSEINVYDKDTLISTFSIFDEVKDYKTKDI